MVRKVYLVGCGMGGPDTLTEEARHAIARASLLVGAPRLVQQAAIRGSRTLELVNPDRIEAELREADEAVACVLLSGDVGFYSGAAALYERLGDFEVEAIPGISSVVCFCAKLHVPWQDVRLVSAHGREHNAVGVIQSSPRTFLLTGGATKVRDVCEQLVARGLGNATVHVGERLTYDDERIVHGSAFDLAGEDFADLSVMLVENDRPISRAASAPCLPDDAFLRGDAPMTKEEVRELAVCKLRIAPDAVVWDVGAGTGSVSVEAAFAAREGTVYAVERDSRALELIAQNREKFGTVNVIAVPGEAPDALADLPAPDSVFVGGSGGSLQRIVACALAANPGVRLVIAAITLETLAEAMECLRAFELADVDIAQVSVAKARELGSYHLMMGQNPIYLVSASGQGRA